MNPKILSSDIHRIRENLNQDFKASFSEFYQFVNIHAEDQATRFKAIFLASCVNDFLTIEHSTRQPEKLIEKLRTEAFDILTSVEHQQGNVHLSLNEQSKRGLERQEHEVLQRNVYEARNIARKNGRFSIKPISFNLRLGEITSIVGKNGTGKSTLLKMIAGELALDSGEAVYYDMEYNELNWKKIKEKTAYIPQDLPKENEFLSIRKQLHFSASIKGILGEKNNLAVSYIISRLGLSRYENYSSSALSGGYKLRFELAKQLVWSPRLLIMDEPLAHLDIKAQGFLLNDLRNLTNSLKTPISIILSSQNLYEIENISDNIIYLHDGEARYNGRVKDISKINDAFSYLLDAECTIQMLRTALQKHAGQIIEIRSELNEMLIFTTKNISPNVLIGSIIEANIPIRNFRDISNSTRTFFETQKEQTNAE